MTTPSKYEAQRVAMCRQLKETAAKKGITQDQIAERTGFTQSNVNRMLSGRYAPSLDNFLKLTEAVECLFSITDKEGDTDT